MCCENFVCGDILHVSYLCVETNVGGFFFLDYTGYLEW